MTRLLAIDPGPEVSGVVGYDTESGAVEVLGTSTPNGELSDWIWIAQASQEYEHLAIEMIASYGMAVGKSTFETVLWIGRFMELFGWDSSTKIYRKDVKMEICGNVRAKDKNIRRELFDRFPQTGGGAEPAVGTKAQPGPLYGISKHAISALAVAVTWAAMHGSKQSPCLVGTLEEGS